MNSLKIYGAMFIALSSFGVAYGMEEGAFDENIEFETFNLTHRSPVKTRVVPVSPRVSRKKQESNVLPQGLDAWQTDAKSNSASPNLLRKVLKDVHEKELAARERELRGSLSRVSPVRSRKSNKDVKTRQLSLLKPAKKA